MTLHIVEEIMLLVLRILDSVRITIVGELGAPNHTGIVIV